MKNPELYNKTIDILVKAYYKGTLEMGNDCACAVGNLIAANLGYTYRHTGREVGSKYVWNETKASWFWVIYNGKVISPSKNAQFQVDSTGYNWDEILLIESAFEQAPLGKNDDEEMFNGLMAVVEALDIIHENTDKVLTTTVKAKFQKA